jgi:hypothetical protein
MQQDSLGGQQKAILGVIKMAIHVSMYKMTKNATPRHGKTRTDPNNMYQSASLGHKKK